MLTLINPNRMRPPIAPLGLNYVGGAALRAGIDTELLDLGLTSDPDGDLARYFDSRSPSLVGIGFRNVDDCFWPSGTWFVPDLAALIGRIRTFTSAPIVLGGVGFSAFARRLVEVTGADYGVRGDGERAIVALATALTERCSVTSAPNFGRIPGLIHRSGGTLIENRAAWDAPLDVPTERNFVDEEAYFRLGGQTGLETKRGCPRPCTYCADPVAKGTQARLRSPSEVAAEFSALLSRGVDMVHLCDGEFNVPYEHALAVCEELVRQGLGDRVRWYAYAAVTPFDDTLAVMMRRAGCVGINFTGDSADPRMLRVYGQTHGPSDIGETVRLCRTHGITCMVDLLLGAPGETPETVANSISRLKEIGPDAVGAALGLRLYPQTRLAEGLLRSGSLEKDPGLRRHYDGPVDLLRPTFYIAPELGEAPARLVRELIAGDERFFPPADEGARGHAGEDHNYNDHAPLAEAIARGARGAYWDILRKLPKES